MCQVHTATFVALLAPEKTDYTACHLEKTTTYILHVVPITTRTHVRRESIGNTKKEKTQEKENGYSDSRSPCDKPKQALIALICCGEYIWLLVCRDMAI